MTLTCRSHEGSLELIRRDEKSLLAAEASLRRTKMTYEALGMAWERIPTERLPPEKGVRATVDLGKTIGQFAVVKAPVVRPQDLAQFAALLHSRHHRPSRVIQSDLPAPATSLVTLVAEWEPAFDGWRLRTIYPGHYVPPQPWDFQAIWRSGLKLQPVLDYWLRSAFLWDVTMFHRRVHEDTLAGLLEQSAREPWQNEILDQIGYEEVRRLWASDGV